MSLVTLVYSTFGANRPVQQLTPLHVRALRLSVGFGVEDFAGLLGVDLETVQRWERGESIPRGEHARRLEELVDCVTDPNPAAAR